MWDTIVQGSVGFLAALIAAASFFQARRSKQEAQRSREQSEDHEEVKEHIDNAFARVSERVDCIDERLERVEGKVDRNSQDLGHVKTTLAVHEDRFNRPLAAVKGGVMADILWGYDISNWQGYNFPHAKAKSEGFSYAMFKATDGTNYRDPTFAGNLAQGRAAGLKTAAYHYQRDVSAAAQLANIEAVVPKDCPLIIDVEKDSGSFSLTLDLIRRCRAAGYTVCMLYLPKWYWQQIGRPNMAAADCPLWYSIYASNKGGYASQIWARARSWYLARWGGYGGLGMAVMQFTSHATVAGRSPIDSSVFRGSQAQLDALFGGSEEDDLNQEQDEMLRDIREQLCGYGARKPGQFGGWKQLGGRTLVDAIAYKMRKLKTSASVGDEVDKDFEADEVTYARNADGYGYDTQKRLDALTAQVSALTAAVSAKQGISTEELTKVVNDAVAENLRITGTVEITGKAK